MAQSGVILNIQHQLADILDNQKLILKNQNGILNRLGSMECRLLNMETQFFLKNQNGSVQNGDKRIQSLLNEIQSMKAFYEEKMENGKGSEESDEEKTISDEEEDDEESDGDGSDDENTMTSCNSDKMSQSALNAIDTDQYISASELKKISKVSKSRGNFAALLVQNLFDKHERASSNVMGSRGKRQLSPTRMKVVKKLTLKMYPPKNENDLEAVWKKECIKAIDSKNRKIKILSDGGVATSTASACIFKVKLNGKK